MIKPLFLKDGRCFAKSDKTYIFDKKNPVLDDQGNPAYKTDQMMTVVSCTLPELKKGDKIFPIIRGGVPIYKEETKKNQFVVLDVEDIYAQEV